ncbi:MAG: hypothetical protein ABSB88_11365 [Bryobacteraceae bacterium]|jgi:hypothetical protein
MHLVELAVLARAAGMSKKIEYEKSLVSYVDILGFGELIGTRSAEDISEIIREVKEDFRPYRTKVSKTRNGDFVNFSDMNITSIPLNRRGARLACEILFDQLMHLVQAQSTRILQGIVVRGGVTVGEIVKSQRQLFGPAVVRAYELESKIAIYPRIVVGKEVLDELKEQTGARAGGRPGEGENALSLLREGDDGQFYIDYLWAVRGELGDDYGEFLDRHGSLISDGLKNYTQNAAIRSKYEWLDHYHRSVLARLNDAS